MKSKGTAAILALLLGGIGAHKFYLDQTFQGLLYVVFCWTFIPACLALVEAVVYLTMDDYAFQQKYGGQRYLPAQASPQQTAQSVTVNLAGAQRQQGASVSDELLKLSQLRTAGVLSEQEFQAQKIKLLQ